MGSKGRPYRSVHVDGFEILIGRGDEENDALTFDVAAPEDLWLHVGGGVAGSHVVVRNPEGLAELPAPVVERAAELAAWYSKARHAGRVEVHVCRVADNYSAVTGACLMTPRATFDAVGGLSEQFPLNFNDIDYCLKVQHDLGQRVVYDPDTVLFHFESSSRDEGYDGWELELFRRRWRHATVDDPFVSPNFHPIAGSMVPPVYRADGKGYLPTGPTHLFVMPADGGTARQMTRAPLDLAPGGSRGSGYAWTPDGKALVISAYRRPANEEEPLDSELYKVSVADGTTQALTDRRGPDHSPAVSPDGATIAFTSIRLDGTPDIWLMARDGTQQRPLRIAFGVLSSKQSEQFIDEIARAVAPHPVFVHHDFSKVPVLRPLQPNVTVLRDPVPTAWGDWSLVAATMRLMERALEDRDVTHFQLLSESCLPVRPLAEFENHLRHEQPDFMIDMRPLDEPQSLLSHGWRYLSEPGWLRRAARLATVCAWQRAGHAQVNNINLQLAGMAEGPLARVRQWVGYQVLMAIAWRHRKRLRCLGGQRLAIGSQWFGASRRGVDWLLRARDALPRLTRHFERSHIPDEAYLHTLVSCAQAAALPLVVRPGNHALYWDGCGTGPDALAAADLPRVLASGRHFARKFPLEAGHDVPPGSDMADWPDWTPYTYPFNLSQQPALSIPAGRTRDGLPVGLQIVGPRHSDDLVLAVGRYAEAVLAAG